YNSTYRVTSAVYHQSASAHPLLKLLVSHSGSGLQRNLKLHPSGSVNVNIRKTGVLNIERSLIVCEGNNFRVLLDRVQNGCNVLLNLFFLIGRKSVHCYRKYIKHSALVYGVLNDFSVSTG